MFETFIKKFRSDENYYTDFDFITNSQLGLISRSPATYDHYKNNPSLRPETKALKFGRAFHLCMLEPKKFDDQVVVEPEVNKRTKAGKEEIAKFNEDNIGNTILTKDDYTSLIGMRNRLFSSHECMDLLSSGEAELPQVWRDEDIDVLCKCKADYWNKDKKILVDIKTTTDASPSGFKLSVKKYSYDRQSAYYSDGFNADRFIFIVIEKTAPYNMGIYECSGETLEVGRDKYKYLLGVYKKFFINSEIDPYEFVHQELI